MIENIRLISFSKKKKKIDSKGSIPSDASVQFNGQSAQLLQDAGWEIVLAYYIYYYTIPAFQFTAAIFFADTWQYFYHRLVHVNKWLYSMVYINSAIFERSSSS